MSRRLHSSPLPFSKAADLPSDDEWLLAAYELMDHYPDILSGQHAIRKWEYAMAIRALVSWRAARLQINSNNGRNPSPIICDVGGAGSAFWKGLAALSEEPVLLIDPNAPPGQPEGQCVLYNGTVEQYVTEPGHPLGQFDVITCISVIEHVEHLRPFFRAVRALLKPGGLLFLTTDYTNTEGDDIFHFHWMRLRIYNAGRIGKLLEDVREIGFRSYGEADWAYHGHQVYDYSVCSLALTRKDTDR